MESIKSVIYLKMQYLAIQKMLSFPIYFIPTKSILWSHYWVEWKYNLSVLENYCFSGNGVTWSLNYFITAFCAFTTGSLVFTLHLVCSIQYRAQLPHSENPRFCTLLWYWASYLIYLCLSFLICKMDRKKNHTGFIGFREEHII